MENRNNRRNTRKLIARISIVVLAIAAILLIAFYLGVKGHPKTSAKPAPVHVNMNWDTPVQPRATVSCYPMVNIVFSIGTQIQVLSEAKQYLRMSPVEDLTIANIRVNLAQGALLIVDDAPKCVASRLWYPVHVSGTDISGWVALSGPDAKGSDNEIQLLKLAD